MFSFITPKIIIQPSVWWIIGGVVTGGGILLKLVTMGFISRKESFKEFRSKEVCELTVGNIEDKIDSLHTDIKDIGKDIKEILRNNKK